MARRITVIGCGVIGAMVAYELSQAGSFEITVFDRQQPAQASTGAALGVLMGVISHKVKGRNWRLRQLSLERYESLIPELEKHLQRKLSWNQQGIVSLCFDADRLPRWESLQDIRQSQGYPLEIWLPQELQQRCPDINSSGVAAAIYSPRDRQISPTELTWACIEAAQKQGVNFSFDRPVTGFEADGHRCLRVRTPQGKHDADLVVIAAGLDTQQVSQTLSVPMAIGPVLGQAVRFHLDTPINHPQFQPVINGNDIHLVPLGRGDYWVGATVEFPAETSADEAAELLHIQPDESCLQGVIEGAIAYCPALARGTITDSWFGLRPRPQGQAAPIIQPLGNYENIWIASGHYRNGVLLAPATALTIAKQVRSHFQNGL